MNDEDPLAAIESAIAGARLPPVKDWHPGVTRDVAIRIDVDGRWFYQGSPIERQRMVRLFSTLLRADDDGETYLVTPQERLRINVDDAPFTAVAVETHVEAGVPVLVFTTNVDARIIADADHRVEVDYAHVDADPRPYLHVRDGLRALISRAVFLELAELAVLHDDAPGIWSRATFMPLGPASRESAP